MTPAAAHPRRRPARNDDQSVTPSLVDSLQNMSIRKGDTFHPTTQPCKSSFWDPLEERAKQPSMPGRSTTSPQSLEDLLIGAGERRVAQLLTRVDKAIAAKSKVALSNVLSEPEVLPVPTFMVNDTTLPNTSQKSRTRNHSHSSDSGIGSSIAESADETVTAQSAKTRPATAPCGSDQSLSRISDAVEQERGLSKYAADQIHKHIVKPILREDSLKEFHGLIKSVPTRIGDKEIKNLRDLEKTLIFLAPDYATSPNKYLRFCERTIRVLHTTVTTLHESDQRAPTDRPYTQGYFFDLVEQIRRYATILAATRAAQAAKQESDDTMAIEKGESVSLHGGMTHNGKPAELVRHTADGKVISLATGQALTDEDLESGAMKRGAHDADVDDEDALRSMARRKKNAKPEIHSCELCDKEFKRPCDLTKHIKTHERPWKCPTEDCKYHEYGWPTEKERDRHVNDKHSSTPSLYHCLFKPCPYTSKRESNCKQHMEKAHGWQYVRSKSNGKGRASNVVRLNQGSVPPSPSSAMLTPLTPIAPSPSMHSLSESSRRGSMAPPPSTGPSNYGTPAFSHPSPDFSGHFNMNFDFNDLTNFPTHTYPFTPATSEDRHASASISSHSDVHHDGSSFDDASPQDFNFDNFTFGEINFQAYTPDSGIAGMSAAAAPHISPGAQVDQTFSEPMIVDTGFAAYAHGPTGDFTLFGNASSSARGDMFPALERESTWGNLGEMGTTFGANYDPTKPPTMNSGNSALEDLFPELKDQR